MRSRLPAGTERPCRQEDRRVRSRRGECKPPAGALRDAPSRACDCGCMLQTNAANPISTKRQRAHCIMAASLSAAVCRQGWSVLKRADFVVNEIHRFCGINAARRGNPARMSGLVFAGAKKSTTAVLTSQRRQTYIAAHALGEAGPTASFRALYFRSGSVVNSLPFLSGSRSFSGVRHRRAARSFVSMTGFI